MRESDNAAPDWLLKKPGVAALNATFHNINWKSA